MRLILVGLVVVGFVFNPVFSPAAAWGQTGHRVTAAIAQAHLGPAARAEIADVLGSETLVEASTWPDFMRSDPRPFWKVSSPPWHYVTVPDGKTYAEVGPPPEGDAVTALAKFTEILRDPKTSRADKALALKFTVHIIGDLHQPFHAGNGLDRGATQVKVKFFGRATHLHRVWDNDIIDAQKFSYSELTQILMNKITDDDIQKWQTAEPLVWIGENVALRLGLYPDGNSLKYAYVFQHRDTIFRRLSQAGIRMAYYLNALYDDAN